MLTAVASLQTLSPGSAEVSSVRQDGVRGPRHAVNQLHRRVEVAAVLAVAGRVVISHTPDSFRKARETGGREGGTQGGLEASLSELTKQTLPIDTMLQSRNACMRACQNGPLTPKI